MWDRLLFDGAMMPRLDMGTVTRTSLYYLEQVETFFLSLCGRGLMVSPADAQLVHAWEEAGVPADVVCRGIAHAFAKRRSEGRSRAFGSDAPRSIRGCQAFIELEVQSWHSREVGRNDWQPERDAVRTEEWLGQLLERIEVAGRGSPDPAAKSYWRRAWRGVRDLLYSVQRDAGKLGGASLTLASLEAQLLAELFAGLAPIEAVNLRRRAEATVHLSRTEVSPRAYAAAQQLALESELRARFGLFSLVPETP